jgi:hypothetical protein
VSGAVLLLVLAGIALVARDQVTRTDERRCAERRSHVLRFVAEMGRRRPVVTEIYVGDDRQIDYPTASTWTEQYTEVACGTEVRFVVRPAHGVTGKTSCYVTVDGDLLDDGHAGGSRACEAAGTVE